MALLHMLGHRNKEPCMIDDIYSGFPAVIATRLLDVFRNSGWSLSVQWQAAVCRVRFADGRMMLVNFDINHNRVWLAGGQSSSEYVYRQDNWISVQSGTELYADTAKLLDSMATANAQSAQKGQVDTFGNQIRKQHANMQSASRFRWSYLLLPVLAFVGYRYLVPSNKETFEQSLPPSAMAPASDKPVQGCEPNRPANGAGWTSGSHSGSAQSAKVSISNNHSRDMVVFLTRTGSAVALQSVYLRSGSRADVAVIPGDYEMMFSVGTVWCSLEAGFKDGDRSKLNQPFSIRPEQPLVLELQSTGSQAAAFGVFVRNEAPAAPPAVQILGDGEMRLQRAQDGHYYLQGSVSGRPVDFLVDTGASFTTLKQDVAQAGGIQNCQATQSKTANGIVDVCIGIIPEIRIGAYIVRNAVVVANPKTEANLLGMNVLGQFKIRTESDVMTLTRP